MLVRNRIPVLLQETLDLVRDIERVMCDCERGLSEARLLEDLLVLGLVQLVVQLLQEGRVRAGRETRLFIEEGEDTEFAFDDVDTGLVVGELDECPVDLLADVLVLLKLEDVRVELVGTSIIHPRTVHVDSRTVC